MAKKKETFQEMYERYKNDPKIMQSDEFKECERFADAMNDLSSAIVSPCIDYANEHGDDDTGWTYTILISLARATCKLLYAMQKTQTHKGKDVFKFYTEELLPLCRQISDSESDDAIREAKRKDSEDGDEISFESKKDVILSIADPNMSVDDIIDKFFKKDLNDEQRKKLAEYIEQMRVEHADKLKQVREHTDENGNYKA